MIARNLNKLLVIASLSLPAIAFADEPKNVAQLTDADGTVMVDHGKGFVTTKKDAPLFENDRVVTLDGSMAEITFTNGCRAKLKSNNLMVVSVDPGCKFVISDATQAPPPAVAGTNLASYIPPLAGVAIIIHAISYETNGFGSFNHRPGFSD